MLAVVEIGGMQFEVEPKAVVHVPHLQGEPGDAVEFNNILLGSENNKTSIGTPFLQGSVKATIIEHGKDEKVLVFHKKRRKGYRKLNGHRQQYTKIEITDIKFANA
jgi:large subunit ribosomal protein L21